MKTTQQPSISICIPVYNLDVSQLVGQLHQQIEDNSYPIDILLIDDCSAPLFRKKNQKLELYNTVTYIELSENVGRSKIRNLFLQYCSSDFLIFMDCDSIIVDESYLHKYLMQVTKDVVCGGRIYGQKPTDKKQLLHWKYGTYKESKSCTQRAKDPNRSFMTNNFMINKKLLCQIKFDERISKYGHEDTLFGYQLKKRNIIITHINNPILHNDVESCSSFIEKTEYGIENLCLIITSKLADKEFGQQIDLIKAAQKLKKARLLHISKLLFRAILPPIKYMLSNGNTNLVLFNIYKLGYFCINCASAVR